MKDGYLTLIPRLMLQTFPFFGVEPAILNEHGEELEGEAEGYLVSLYTFIYPFKGNSSSSPAWSTDQRTDRRERKMETGNRNIHKNLNNYK